MANIGSGIYSYVTYLSPGDSGAFFFLNDSSLGAREIIPSECALHAGIDRKYKIGNADCEFAYTWATCFPVGTTSSPDDLATEKTKFLTIEIYPNPAQEVLYIKYSSPGRKVTLEMFDLSGRLMESRRNNGARGITSFDLSTYTSSIYVLKSTDGMHFDYKKVILCKSL